MKKQPQIKQSNKVLTESLLEKTIQDLKKFMLQTFASKDDLQETLKPYATKEDLKAYATKNDVIEIVEHITETLAEEIKGSENRIISRLGSRVGLVENITDDHEKRLKVLEHAKN